MACLSERSQTFSCLPCVETKAHRGPGGPGEGEAERKGGWQAPGQGVCVSGADFRGSPRTALRVGGIRRAETPRRNVPRMLGAAYLRPGMCCGIISRQPSRLWSTDRGGGGGTLDTCLALPAQTACAQPTTLRRSLHVCTRMCGCGSVCLRVSVSLYSCNCGHMSVWGLLCLGMCVQLCTYHALPVQIHMCG